MGIAEFAVHMFCKKMNQDNIFSLNKITGFHLTQYLCINLFQFWHAILHHDSMLIILAFAD